MAYLVSNVDLFVTRSLLTNSAASDNVDQSAGSAFRLEEGSISGDASTKQWRRSLRPSRSVWSVKGAVNHTYISKLSSEGILTVEMGSASEYSENPPYESANP